LPIAVALGLELGYAALQDFEAFGEGRHGAG
jgi:hypothetical protein